MGDIDVDIFQETLKQLITSSNLSLIIEEKHQLQSLEDEIKYLRGFLKHTENIRNDHPEVMKLVMQIRALVAEAENIVELFVVYAFKADHPPIRKKKKKKKQNKNKKQHQMHLSLDLGSVKERMKTLTSKVKKIYDQKDGVAVKLLEHSSTGSGEGSSRGATHLRAKVKEIYDNPIFGYEAREGGDSFGRRRMERKTEARDLLNRKTEDLQVISIIGMWGLGKTTLANKVLRI